MQQGLLKLEKGKATKERRDKISEQLITVAGQHNLAKIKQTIKKGAKINYVQYEDANCWYGGNSKTALYCALNTLVKIGREEEFIEVVKYLLQNGADPKFRARRGGWNGSNTYSITNNLASQLKKLPLQNQRLQLLQLLSKYQVDLNSHEHYSSSKDWGSSMSSNCLAFKVISEFQLPNILQKLKDKLGNVEIQKLIAEHEKQLRRKYYQCNNIKQKEEKQNNQPSQRQQTKIEEFHLELLQRLIEFGADCNCYLSHSYYTNLQLRRNRDEQENYKLIKDNFQKVSRLKQSLLHWAIINNLPKFTEFLIEKGAKIDDEFEISISKAFQFEKWPAQLKQYLIAKKKNRLQRAEERKVSLEEQLKKSKENQRETIQEKINQQKLEIFIQKQYLQEGYPMPPLQRDEVVRLSCNKLAEILDVDGRIKQRLRVLQQTEERVKDQRPTKRKMKRIEKKPKKRVEKRRKNRK